MRCDAYRNATPDVLERKSGFRHCVDGDGDRVILVDHRGNIVDGDESLFIVVNNVFSENKLRGGVVGTVM